jgi:hypothetical protein
MKEYIVIRGFWRKGILQPAGSVITMLKTEAKYLAHALEEKAVEVEQKVEAAVKKAVRVPKALTVAVAEAPADGEQSN